MPKSKWSPFSTCKCKHLLFSLVHEFFEKKNNLGSLLFHLVFSPPVRTLNKYITTAPINTSQLNKLTSFKILCSDIHFPCGELPCNGIFMTCWSSWPKTLKSSEGCSGATISVATPDVLAHVAFLGERHSTVGTLKRLGPGMDTTMYTQFSLTLEGLRAVRARERLFAFLVPRTRFPFVNITEK